jgi:hypothetical protein
LEGEVVAAVAGRVVLVVAVLKIGVQAVLVDEEPGHVEEGLRPDLAGGVLLGVGLVVVVGEGVDGLVEGVGVPANALAGDGVEVFDVVADGVGGALGVGRLHGVPDVRLRCWCRRRPGRRH